MLRHSQSETQNPDVIDWTDSHAAGDNATFFTDAIADLSEHDGLGLIAPVAEPQCLDRPWQAGLRRMQRQHLPHDLEGLARVLVRVDLVGLGGKKHLAARGGRAQAIELALGHAREP